ncbi:MAG TPA: hypothetical protein VMM38_14080 [Aridibacter sp.]|nr:hypothetical protein [Aridibacter sp.]
MRELRRSNRARRLEYQQRYYRRLLEDRRRLAQARYYDSLVYDYRYNRGGNNYYTSSYGAEMLRRAVQLGYEEGYRAGLADRNDRWRYDYRDTYAYQDGTYGYDSYYVGLSEYRHYFREGFSRGYEDGYYSRSRYGRGNNLFENIVRGIISIFRF